LQYPSAGFFTSAILAASLIIATSFEAQASFDSVWNVQIITEKGACDRVYRYPVAIKDNQVRFRNLYGETSSFIAGEIGKNGRVVGTIGDGQEAVNVRGRLTTASGSGVWAAPSRGCSGRWTAERREAGR